MNYIKSLQSKVSVFTKLLDTFKAEQTTTVQTLILAKSRFETQEEARAWVTEHDFRTDKVDETEDSWRFRQRDPGDFDPDSFRTIDLDDGVKAVIGKLKESAKADNTIKIFKPGHAIKDMDPERRRLMAYASTNEWDRYGERFEADAFRDGIENYVMNPVIQWAHDYTMPPIGKALDFQFDSKGLILTIEFSDKPFAKDIFDLYNGGFLNAFSVGFRSLESAYEERSPGVMGLVYKKAELLEVSAVPIPANPGALVTKGIMPQACRVFGSPSADEQDPIAGGYMEQYLNYLSGVGKMLKSKKVKLDEKLQSAVVQCNNILRELVYGDQVPQIEPQEDFNGEELNALVKEINLLSAQVKDESDKIKLGKLADTLIQGLSI